MSEPTDIDNDDDEAFAEATLTQAIENQIESGERRQPRPLSTS